MLKTAEMRWFWPAQNLETLQTWFSEAGGPPEREIRTDSYLVLPDCRTTGVKIRATLFEIKALTVDAGIWTFPTGQSGRLLRWVKWTHAGTDPSTLQEELCTSGTWQPVSKERFRRKFAVAGEAVSEISSPGAVNESGCNVELTRVSVAGRQPVWLTLGLEAIGPDGQLLDILKRVGEVFFCSPGSPPGIKLSELNSFGYPEWLNRQVSSER